ncbi:MAG: tRNA (N(6)-L-threonylcarbamoyladenosine(37)-C(2))-methylthiotransferase MtaB, partial [Clostridia bacterium]|nr:tRNA (N(6)-L-threonylcarbamoyladenosine(37)-C(2))-methylthiotransferase MtaB [Clostridia bacterium]
MRTIATYTLGCKVNQYDTEAMLESFERAGYHAVPFHDAADVYLINTCTVTGTGDQKSLKTIRRVAREHPECAVVVCGCLAQREAERLAGMDNVKLVVGVQRRGEVVELLESALASGETINAVAPLKGAGFERLSVSRHEGKTRATMKIQEGCDRYCSYCIIPSVRGPVRSMPLDEVAAEAARLAAAGYLEIVVTGIHLASYGRGTDHTLLDAVRAVHDAPGVRRVRLGSLEPMTVTEDFARAVSGLPGLMRQFHLSLQSGSAAVLKRMRRRYTPQEYLRAVETLRKHMPDCAVTTDVIVGFPGETEAEFRETLEFVERAKLARIHVFPSSRRKGTGADDMEGQVPEGVKHAR